MSYDDGVVLAFVVEAFVDAHGFFESLSEGG